MPKSLSNKKGFHMRHDHATLLFAKNKTLNNSDRRIFDFLSAKMCFKNRIFITQIAIARELELTRASVCNSLAKLEKQGYLRRGKTRDGMAFFMVDKRQSWKGKRFEETKAQVLSFEKRRYAGL